MEAFKEYNKRGGNIMYYKLTSRKFWVSMITIISGLVGLVNIGDSSIGMILSGLMTLLPTIVYVITEGKIDAEDIKRAANTVNDVINKGDKNGNNGEVTDAK